MFQFHSDPPVLHDPSERPDLDAVRMRLMPDKGYLTLAQTGAQNNNDGGYITIIQSGSHGQA